MVFFPLLILALISPVTDISSPKSLFIVDDLPAPLGPANAVVFPLSAFSSSSKPSPVRALISLTSYPTFLYTDIKPSPRLSVSISSLLNAMIQGSFSFSRLIRNLSRRLREGSGFFTAKIIRRRSTFATSGLNSEFLLGRSSTTLPVFLSSSMISMMQSSPTSGLRPSFRKAPFALHS